MYIDIDIIDICGYGHSTTILIRSSIGQKMNIKANITNFVNLNMLVMKGNEILYACEKQC